MSEHQHPGEHEPRSYGQTHHENLDIDLNSASFEELARLPMVGSQRAQQIIDRRPFRSWDDVMKVPGFETGMVDDLKSGGAKIDEQ